MRPRALTFDAYGTLLEDARGPLRALSEDIVKAFDLGLRPGEFLRGWEGMFYDLLEGGFMRMRDANLASLQRMFDSLGIEGDPGPFVERAVEEWGRRPAYPEVGRVLRQLSGLPMALVTNADEGFLRKALKASGLRFPVVVTSEAVGAYKPDPRPLRAAVQALGADPREVLHVGDSLTEDVAGARAVGMRCAWVDRRGRGPPTGLLRPDFVLRDLEDLLEIIP
jgi:2-haloacid dehalogenase/putative hydrolase of the HAD superfamily